MKKLSTGPICLWLLSLGGTRPRLIIFCFILLRIQRRFGSDLEKHFPDLGRWCGVGRGRQARRDFFPGCLLKPKALHDLGLLLRLFGATLASGLSLSSFLSRKLVQSRSASSPSLSPSRPKLSVHHTFTELEHGSRRQRIMYVRAVTQHIMYARAVPALLLG